jgi:hypothetical protein
MDHEPQLEIKNFVEDVGIFFEQSGLPRMAGRILGWLLICDTPQQPTSELVKALKASNGSISTTTRLLIKIGLIERFSMPGIRHDYFRIKPGVWHHLIKESQVQTTAMRQLAERGLGLLKEKPPLNRQRLEEMRDVYTFFEREFPALLERWEQEHKVQ